MTSEPIPAVARFEATHNERDCVSHSSNVTLERASARLPEAREGGTGGRGQDRDARAHLYLQGWSAESKPRAGDFGALRVAAERALRQALPVLLSPGEVLALVEMAEGGIRG